MLPLRLPSPEANHAVSLGGPPPQKGRPPFQIYIPLYIFIHAELCLLQDSPQEVCRKGFHCEDTQLVVIKMYIPYVGAVSAETD